MTIAKGFVAAGVLPVLLAGCSPYVDSRVPEPIRPIVEPVMGREYLLYRPSEYDKRQRWPLIVVCHGGFPDNPNRQIRAWTELAESTGFFVLAPSLTVTDRKFGTNVAESLARQHADERLILAAVNHVRGAYNISDDRIFLYGWSRGALAALHTGLRNHSIFRAISVAQPKIDVALLAAVNDAVDPYQPIQVRAPVTDSILGGHGHECADWLYTVGAHVREEGTGAVRKTDCDQSVDFIESVIRNEPWIFIRAYPSGSGNPLEYQFKLSSTIDARQYRWTFGDGEESPIAEPVHTFAKGGVYDVRVSMQGGNKGVHRRSLDVRVP
ncbi:MAG: hypothetical protein IH987_19715 [Planctomycetes bacterium]|nr:hypothetical protein [Planctomycetota bacterium]